MTPAPTISLSGVMLCVGYSCMHLHQYCVSVQLCILTVYIEKPSHGCKALAFSTCLFLSSAKVVALVQWRWCGWEGKARACRTSAWGRAYLWTATAPKGLKAVPGWAARVYPLHLFHNKELEPKAINEAETGMKWPVLYLKHRVVPLSQKQCKQEIMSQESKSSFLCLAFFWGTGDVLFTPTTSPLSSAERCFGMAERAL